MPRLAAALEGLPEKAVVEIDSHNLRYIDHSCLELIRSWNRLRSAAGADASIDWAQLKACSKGPSLTGARAVYSPAE